MQVSTGYRKQAEVDDAVLARANSILATADVTSCFSEGAFDLLQTSGIEIAAGDRYAFGTGLATLRRRRDIDAAIEAVATTPAIRAYLRTQARERGVRPAR
jgi:hypothetical protein